MANVKNLRFLVKQRLNAAVDEVCELIERSVAEYEEQLRASKEENQRQQKLLDASQLKKEDVQQVMVENEEVPPERQSGSLRVKQELSQPMTIKEEPVELWCSQDPQGAEEVFPDSLKSAPVCVKSGEDDKMETQSSKIPEKQSEGNEDTKHLKAEPHEEDGDFHTETNLPSDASDSSNSDTDDSDNWKDSVQSFLGPRSYSPERREIDAGKGSPNTATTPACSSRENQEEEQGPSFRCKVCSSSFSKKIYLQQHMFRHTKEKTFLCPVCNKAYIWKGERDRHMRTHTGERPYCCQVCNLSFTSRSYLKRHARIHSGEKPYSCHDCGKTFTWHQSFSKHLCAKKKKKSSKNGE